MVTSTGEKNTVTKRTVKLSLKGLGSYIMKNFKRDLLTVKTAAAKSYL